MAKNPVYIYIYSKDTRMPFTSNYSIGRVLHRDYARRKNLPRCFSKRARAIESRNRKILDYIYIYIYISDTCGSGKKPPPPPSKANDNSSFTESFFGYLSRFSTRPRPMSGA